MIRKALILKIHDAASILILKIHSYAPLER